jgi:hypothetical protein
MNGSEAFMGLTVKEKQSVIRESYQRYQSSGKKDKSKILDELCQITGLNRKYLLHLLANWGKTHHVTLNGKRLTLKAAPPAKPRKKRAGKIIYGPEVLAHCQQVKGGKIPKSPHQQFDLWLWGGCGFFGFSFLATFRFGRTGTTLPFISAMSIRRNVDTLMTTPVSSASFSAAKVGPKSR